MYYLKGLASFNDELGFLGQFLGQDVSERDAKAAREAFDAFKDLVTATRTASTRRMRARA